MAPVKVGFYAAIFSEFGMNPARVYHPSVHLQLSCRRSKLGRKKHRLSLESLACELGAELESFTAKFGISVLVLESHAST